MSKFAEAVDKYKQELSGLGQSVDEQLLQAVAKGLGPSIYNNDSKLVACSDKEELARIKQNFLIKKLGMSDGANLDAALESVCKRYEKRQKHRAVFYYMLVQELGQEAYYRL